MGRPTTNPRNTSLHLRISEAESDLINECAKLSGRPRTDIIMEGVALVYKHLQEEKK